MRFLEVSFAGERSVAVRSLGRLAACGLLAFSVYLPAAAADEGNWLFLELVPPQAQGYVRLTNDGEVVAQQTLARKSVANCGLVTNGSLLAFSSSGGALGFIPQQGRLGIKGTSNGAPCGQVRNNEVLTLRLGSGGGVAGQKVVTGTLSLLIHRNVRILIDARDGEDIVQKFEVRAGTYASTPVPIGVIAIVCPVDGNAPCEVPLEAGDGLRWNSLRFTTVAKNTGESGAWSLGGGTSSFKLLDFNPEGDLDCGDAAQEEGSTLRRLNDVGEDADACTKLPYSVEFDGQTIAFSADYGVLEEGTAPAFAFDVEWRTEVITGPTPPATEYVEEENPPSDLETFVQQIPFSVQWFGLAADPEAPGVQTYLIDYCPGQPVFTDDGEGNPVLTDLTLPPGFDDSENGPNDMSDDLPGFQFGCLITRVAEIVPAELCPTEPDADEICVSVKESGYLLGDWTATRTLR